MKKLLPLLLFLSIHSYGNSHKEMYQKHIDFYKKMYEMEKEKTPLIIKNFAKIKELNSTKNLYFKYKNFRDIYKNRKHIYFFYNGGLKASTFGEFMSGWYTFGGAPDLNYLYLNYANRVYENEIVKQKIKKANLIQSLDDFTDLIEEYSPNTIVEIDKDYNVYINDELLE